MKILAVGFNYASHQVESVDTLNVPLTNSRNPIIFHKGDSVHRLGKPFYLPDWTEYLEYEAEIVVQIDRVGKYIAERFAHRYYNKLTIGLDLTARDLQKHAIAHGQPWTMSKAFDSSAVVGEWIDKRKLGYPEHPIELRLDCNGETVQQGSSQEMIHSIDSIISYLSRQHTLKMGDLIFTGTPAGTGQCRIGQKLEGYLNGHKLLHLDIK